MNSNEKHEVVILARMGEITLKGLNRGKFEHQLIANLTHRLKEFGNFRIFQSQSRLWIEPKAKTEGAGESQSSFGMDSVDTDRIVLAVTQVFGIVSASPVIQFDGGYPEMSSQAVQYVGELLERKPFRSFKILAKRGNKRFPMESPDICSELGGDILDAYPDLSVDVHEPEVTIYVEVREHMYIYSEKVMGHRGLPVGTAGKGMLLLSGGIDSPVAGYMMASRGMNLEAIYFHSYPYTSDKAKEKVIELARLVSQYAGRMKLHIVDFTEIQLELYKNSPQDMLTITMRRIMLRIAEQLSQKNHCQALITGESLGQVASQTLEAVVLTDEVVHMPIFRPLIGTDKDQTVALARKIGTFETSILPYEDCCTVFVAKHPKTHPKPKDIFHAEKNIDTDAMVSQGLEKIETILITFANGEEECVSGS